MKRIEIIFIFLFLMVLFSITAIKVSAYGCPTIFNETFDSGSNWSFSGVGCGINRIANGNLGCDGEGTATFVHELINNTLDNSNWSINFKIKVASLPSSNEFLLLSDTNGSSSLCALNCRTGMRSDGTGGNVDLVKPSGIAYTAVIPEFETKTQWYDFNITTLSNLSWLWIKNATTNYSMDFGLLRGNASFFKLDIGGTSNIEIDNFTVTNLSASCTLILISNNTPSLVINTPLNNSQTHNATPLINFTISDVENDNITYRIYLDHLSNPTTLINFTNNNNTKQGNFTFNLWTILNNTGGSINNTYYLKINGTDNASNVFEKLFSFNLTNDINLYNATNVTILPLNPSSNTQLTAYYNLTNKPSFSSIPNQSDNITIYDLHWIINNTIIKEAGNNTLLNAPNVSLNANISFQVRINNGYGITAWTEFVNSSKINIGDSTAPTFKGNRTNPSSVQRDLTIDLFANTTDINGIDRVIAEVNNPNNVKSNHTMDLDTGIITNGEWIYTFTTSIVGTHNVTFYSRDGSLNEANTDGKLTFEVTAPPSGGSTSTGGGSGATTTIIQSSNATPVLFFGLNSISFFVISVPSTHVKIIKFENKGSGSFADASIKVIGDVSPFIKAQICETPEERCKDKGITIKSGQSAFLRLTGTFNKDIGSGKEGIIRMNEEKEKGKIFDLPVVIDRPPAYQFLIAPISQNSLYENIFGFNELPALLISYTLSISILGMIIYFGIF